MLTTYHRISVERVVPDLRGGVRNKEQHDEGTEREVDRLEDGEARVEDGTEHEAEEDPRTSMTKTCGNTVRKHWMTV